MTFKWLKSLGVAAALIVTPLSADTNKAELPENYRSTFVRYTSVDKPNADDPQKTKMRFFYVNPESLIAAQAGQAAPEGTVLIMEDHAVQRDGSGNALLDSAGRLIPTDEITNIFVQEKQKDWGMEYSEDVRNGEWEYAWFAGDGNRMTDKTMDGCFTCHKSAADTDYNFTYAPFVASIKK